MSSYLILYIRINTGTIIFLDTDISAIYPQKYVRFNLLLTE